MKLSNFTIESIVDFISGDNKWMNRKTGEEIIKLFNYVGVNDVYDSGMPENLSRNSYAEKTLKSIKGTSQLRDLIDHVFDPRNLKELEESEIKYAVEDFNKLIEPDGYQLKYKERSYKVTRKNLPDNIIMEVHFQEIKQKIIAEIRKAKYLIWVAVGWFTDSDLANELYKRKKKGIDIQILLINDSINQTLKLENQFNTQKILPKGYFKNIMHHKFCIIDLKIVIHGSYNWTIKAKGNDEDIAVTESKEITEKYATEFVRLKRTANGVIG